MNGIRDMNFPKVTIVTVTYNLIENGREKYFRQCLESVREQTYPNIEHIVIDGASTDGTLDLIKEYADKGWITYYSELDSGIYDAMNKSIQKATGKYINFLNSDDYFCDNLGLEKSVELLESSQADFSHAGSYFLLDGEIAGKIQNRIEFFFMQMPFCHQTVLMKRQVLISEGMFDANFKSAGDYDLLIRIIMKGYKNISVDANFAVFRAGGLSTKMVTASNDECLRIWKKYFPTMSVIKKRKNGLNFFEFFISRDQLKAITSSVNEKIANNISKLKIKKCQEDMLKIKCGQYLDFLTKTCYLCGVIPFFKIQWRNTFSRVQEKVFSIFNLKILRIKKIKDTSTYYFLYMPVLKIKKGTS